MLVEESGGARDSRAGLRCVRNQRRVDVGHALVHVEDGLVHCEDPAAAGSHYQHQADPKQPSVNPDYANPRNEIWLDFTTDATGSARSESVVRLTLDPNFKRPGTQTSASVNCLIN